MKLKNYRRLFLFLIFVSGFAYSLQAQGVDGIWMSKNRLNGYFANNGSSYQSEAPTFIWPGENGHSLIFSMGLWVSAKVDTGVLVAGNEFNQSDFQPGPISSVSSGYQNRWYIIENENSPDWNKWPVELGAPTDDEGNPLVLGDRTAFSIYNDMGDHTYMKSAPLGVEVHQVNWQCQKFNPLGDIVFVKYRIVNKGPQLLDSSFVSLWLFPEVGDMQNDIAGADIDLNLAYFYNSENWDNLFGEAPPAVGIALLKGPVVDMPGVQDTLPTGELLLNKKMLNISSFVTAYGDYPNYFPLTPEEVWLNLRGYMVNHQPIRDPNGNPVKIMFTGDPVNSTGWLDNVPGGGPALISTGPFKFDRWVDLNSDGIPNTDEPGVQEVVFAIVVAKGQNNINSVAKLKKVVQRLQNYNYYAPVAAAPPLKPKVEKSEMPNAVLISWDETSESNLEGGFYEATEPFQAMIYGLEFQSENGTIQINDSTYNFLGYEIYQYADESGNNPVLVEKFTVEQAATPTRYDKKRYLSLSQNFNPFVAEENTPLVNGRDYYFGVVAKAYMENGSPDTISSKPAIIPVTPHKEPGVRYLATINDTLEVTHKINNTALTKSDGKVIAYVVDPSKTTGDDYRVTFEADENHNYTWDLVNTGKGIVVLENQTNQTGNDAYNVADGMVVKVIGPAPGIQGVVQVDPNNWSQILEPDLNLSLGYLFQPEDPPILLTAVKDSGAYPLQEENLQLWNWQNRYFLDEYVIEFVENPTIQGQLVLNGWAENPDPQTGKWLVRGWKESDTLGGNVQVQNTSGRLPFRAWKVTPSGQTIQITAMIMDENGDWYWGQELTTISEPKNGFEKIYLVDYPYDENEILADGGYAVLKNKIWGDLYPEKHVLGNLVFATWTYKAGPFLGSFPGRPPVQGSVYRWQANKINTENDIFEIKGAPAKISSTDVLKQDLKKINVVPNPFYGSHTGKTDGSEGWVQFTNIPKNSTIRVFDLAGNLIQIFDKQPEGTPYVRWDLRNLYGRPIGSGVYIYHVEVPGVGEKVGKFAVFIPER